MTNILYTTPILENPPAGGPQLRVENTIKALNDVSNLYILSRASPKEVGGDKSVKIYEQMCNRLEFTETARKRDEPGMHTGSLSRIARRLTQVDTKKDARRIVDIVRQNKIDVVWFGFGNISYPLIRRVKKLDPTIRVICDTDSVWSRFILRELPFARNLVRKLLILLGGWKKKREERMWVNLCDITTAVSTVDEEYYRSIGGLKAKIKIFSNVIDVETYQDKWDRPPDLVNPSIYLAGTFGRYDSPMDSAARWLINEIFPLVKKEVPDLKLFIIGRGSESIVPFVNDQSIIVKGKVPSVLPYLQNTDIALVPLMYESGTRFKILEAGACYIPIVSTTLGAEGIPVQNGKDIVLADNAREFSEGIIKLLKDKDGAITMARNCFNLVNKKFSINQLKREAEKILKELGV
ncbi:MAG: glycosyltransferase family 4 protein [Gammaproteobacteria bacterium]|nr:glycosyltransferase family 4 protein [Gammaproteobacteria bacterium]